jgi:hypothetical protein
VRASAADGIFPLVTNLPRDTHPPLEILKIYRYQAFLEKRHEQLKTAAEVVPVNFKSGFQEDVGNEAADPTVVVLHSENEQSGCQKQNRGIDDSDAALPTSPCVAPSGIVLRMFVV